MKPTYSHAGMYFAGVLFSLYEINNWQTGHNSHRINSPNHIPFVETKNKQAQK